MSGFSGRRLRYWRLQAGLSQEALGSRAGISGKLLGRYERDESTPRIDLVETIARVLGITLAHLTGDPSSYLEDVRPPLGTVGAAGTEAVRSAGTAGASDLCLLPFVREWDGTWPLPPDCPRRYVPREYLSGGDCLITVMPDDSMRPYLCRGDALIIDPRFRRRQSRALLVVRVDDSVVIRRYLRTGGRRFYEPFNHFLGLPTIEATGRETVLGRVVGLAGRRFPSRSSDR